MRKLLGTIIWWAIADRMDQLEEYIYQQLVLRWEREGVIMRDAHNSTREYARNLSDEIRAIRQDVLDLKIKAPPRTEAGRK